MKMNMKWRIFSLSMAMVMMVSATQPVAFAAGDAIASASETSTTPADSTATDESASSGDSTATDESASSDDSTATDESASSSDSTATSESASSSEAVEEEQAAPVAIAGEDTSIYEDAAVVDTWTGNDKGTVAKENGWLHLKSTSGDNAEKQFYITNTTANFSQKEGYLEFTVKPNSAPSDSRFGVYLRSNGANDGLFIGYDASGWFWQTYDGKDNSYYTGKRVAAPTAGSETKVRIEYSEATAKVMINGTVAFEKIDLSKIPSSRGGKLAFKAAQWNSTSTDVLVKDIHYPGQKEVATYGVSGTVTADGKALEGAVVTLNGKTATTNAEGSYTFEKVAAGTYQVSVSKEGYIAQTQEITVKDQAVAGLNFELSAVATQKISSEEMDVTIYQNFPAVKQYDFTSGDLKGKTFYGQTLAPNTIQINGKDVVLSDSDVEMTAEGNKATYKMKVKEPTTGVDCTITTVLTVDKNILSMEITDVTYNQENGKEEHPLQTIYFPNHSLVSVRSSQQDATFAGSKMSSNTRVSGDTYKDVTKDLATGSSDYMYSFVSADGMSAAMESNSEYEGSNAASYIGAGGASNTRIWASVTDINGEKSMGLGSALFYWNRQLESKDPSDTTGHTNKMYVADPTENPLVKVIITGNQNDDDKVDWQDGAIAFREISHEIYKSEEVADRVSMRVVENFSSQATNPFMMTLDNVKRIYLNTDGLGQAVLLKGYANEGHDSAHPDYDDIGQRLGGADDMNKLMIEGNKLGAYFGIHVNASEMYTEAKAFDEVLARRNNNGGLVYGWNWLDQGIGIDSKFDLLSGRREARFDSLFNKVGNNLNWVYVDVWGNGTSTLEDSWATRRLSDEITDNGWRMTTEWGPTNEYDSTFQHWATDLTYGGYQAKGYNSTIARFIRNNQKDSWVGDYTTYGGAANAPLLGGYDMKDFEGWQGRSNYDDYINNLFTNDLSTKFFQHFLITQWENGDTIKMSGGSGDSAFSNMDWAPEKRITLKDDTYGTVVVERTDAEHYSEDVMSPYRDRTVTLNGKVVLKGHVSRSDNGDKGDESYLLPWYWDATGNDLSADQQKLYHWNTKGGETTWELPDGWENLANVVVYQLSDTGKINEKTVAVTDGKVTLTADAETPYVVYKGEQKQLDIGGWQGNHLYDTGFNSYDVTASKWDIISGEPTIENTVTTNPMLVLDGGETVTQTITDLVPGKTYALYIGVDNLSDAKAHMTVSSINGTVLGSNYTEKSIANNYVSTDPHSNKIQTESDVAGSRFQNMYVFFTADDTTAKLTLSRDVGEGRTYFDNMRCVENTSNNFTYNEQGEIVGFTQDFEHNAQGIYPFVIGPAEGVSDNRTHLSELHAPYTQGGWDVKKGDDVLDGNWSLKINGLTGYSNVVYQTIPQNFRFEPGYTYKISFDYQAGSEGTYAVVVGDGTSYDATAKQDLHYKADENGVFQTQTFTTEITGAADGQTWFGIYSTNKAADTHGTSGAAASFGDYSNLMIDNVRIERVEKTVNTADLQTLVDSCKDYTFEETGCTTDEWAQFTAALANANTVLNKENASDSELQSAYNALNAAKLAVDNTSGLPADSDKNDIDIKTLKATDGAHQNSQGEGAASQYVLDNDASTVYHSPWNGTEAKNLWVQIDLTTPQTVNGLRYLPRQSGNNGKLVEGKIEVKVKGSDTWQTVTPKGATARADGTFTFDTGSNWSKAVFDAVDNVESVRLTALKTLNDNSGKTFFSAAELRLTKPGTTGEEPAVDTSSLQNLINDASRLDESRYQAESWKALQQKIAEAKALLEKEDVTAQQVSDAATALRDAMDALVMKVYAPQVEEKIAIFDSMKPEMFSAGWDDFAAAATALRAILDDPNATQEQANAALAAFYAAYDKLEMNSAYADLENLKQQIADVEAKKYQESNYTPSSWKTFAGALQNAKDIAAKGANATQDEIAQAMKQLTDAEMHLLALANKNELINTLNDAIKLSEKDYTAETWAVFAQAKKAAEDVYNNADATQQQVDDARKALADAMAQLKKKPTENGKDEDDKNTGNNGNINTNTTTNTTQTPIVQTGDVFSFAGVMAALAASVAGFVALGKKKGKKDQE